MRAAWSELSALLLTQPCPHSSATFLHLPKETAQIWQGNEESVSDSLLGYDVETADGQLLGKVRKPNSPRTGSRRCTGQGQVEVPDSFEHGRGLHV